MKSGEFLSARDVVRAMSARQRPPAPTLAAVRQHEVASVLRILGHAEPHEPAYPANPGVESPANAWKTGLGGSPFSGDGLAGGTDDSAQRISWGADQSDDPDSGSAVPFPDTLGSAVATPDHLLGTLPNSARDDWPTAPVRYGLFGSRALGTFIQAPAASGDDRSATDGDDYGYDSPGVLGGGAEPIAPPILAPGVWPAEAARNELFQPRTLAPSLQAPPTGGDDWPTTGSDDYGHDSPADIGGGDAGASLLIEVIPVQADEIRREAMRSVAATIDALVRDINALREEMFSSHAARNAIFSRLSGV